MFMMTRALAVERVASLDAEAHLNGGDLKTILADKSNDTLEQLRNYLIARGLHDVTRSAEYDQRMKLKILQLDPSHYKQLEETRAERLANYTPAKKSEKIIERERSENIERERRNKETREWMTTMNKALEFYESWKLPDGTPLGDATRDKLITERDRELALADGHLRNRTFYGELANRLENGERVRDKVDIAECHRLREQVFAGENSNG